MSLDTLSSGESIIDTAIVRSVQLRKMLVTVRDCVFRYHKIILRAIVTSMWDVPWWGDVRSLSVASIIVAGNPAFDDETSEAAEDVRRVRPVWVVQDR